MLLWGAVVERSRVHGAVDMQAGVGALGNAAAFWAVKMIRGWQGGIQVECRAVD
jgi:hypothetical protein